MSEPKKFGPSDFAAEVERLKAADKLPSLENLLAAIAEIRLEYVPRILAARQQHRGSNE